MSDPETPLASMTPAATHLLDHLVEGVQVLDRELRYLYVNPVTARQARRQAADLVGRRMADVFPEFVPTEAYRAVERCARLGEPTKMLNEYRYEDGSSAWFDLIISPIPAGVLILSVDMTDAVAMQSRLHVAERLEALGRLAAGVAHDFNNLLTVMLGSLQLASDPGLGAERDRHLAAVRDAAERAAAITSQLLAFGRRQPASPRVVSLNEVVEQLAPMIGRMVGEQVQLHLALDPTLQSVRVDPAQLEQVLLNLAVNARDAMPEGGRLTIETANGELDAAYCTLHPGVEPGRYAMLAVADTGIGMDAATLKRAFEPFFTTKEPGKGSGLGLATCHGIVHQAGGHIWSYSEPGRGTQLKLYFPAHELPAEPRSPVARAAARAGGGETVLAIEDDPTLLRLIAAALEREGFQVLTASEAGEALRIARDHAAPIDLVLADVVIPGVDVQQLVAALRRRHAGTRVVFMSGYTAQAIASNGAIDPERLHFLPKPFTLAELAGKVHAVLHGGG